MVHIVFVWQILFTAQLMLFQAGNAPDCLAAPLQSFSPHPITWTLLLSLAYATYYFLIEQPGVAGPLASCLVMTGYVVTRFLFERFPGSWQPALIIHVFAWVAQIYAHQVYEKRAPAFLDNIVQALVMAPLFVLLEVLFPMGYKADLQQKVEEIALKNIKEFRESSKKAQ